MVTDGGRSAVQASAELGSVMTTVPKIRWTSLAALFALLLVGLLVACPTPYYGESDDDDDATDDDDDATDDDDDDDDASPYVSFEGAQFIIQMQTLAGDSICLSQYLGTPTTDVGAPTCAVCSVHFAVEFEYFAGDTSTCDPPVSGYGPSVQYLALGGDDLHAYDDVGDEFNIFMTGTANYGNGSFSGTVLNNSGDVNFFSFISITGW